MRKINDAGLALIKQSEGMRLDAYLDGGGVPTIGYGHIRGVKMGDTITPGEAERLLLEDLDHHCIEPLLDGAQTSDNQYAAMTSLAFNIGLTRFGQSTVLKRHKQGNKIAAANAFLLWCFDNGKKVAGLEKRRAAERKLYLS